MILSVSRRTDIPAFYTEWLFNRIKEGFALVRNPMNYHQVSRVMLSPEVVDCIVFWTKDPSPLTGKLNLLADYKYYFQITVNPYDKSIERNVPSRDIIVDAFKSISRDIGRKRTIWRYDPIIFTKETNAEYHYCNFNSLCSQLAGFTDQCIISFVDSYRKMERNTVGVGIEAIDAERMHQLGGRFAQIANSFGIKLKTCSEHIDLSVYGIGHAKCIDGELISEIAGQRITAPKDKNQRDFCGCVESIDIGAYNTCRHGCRYCYANYSEVTVKNNVARHDPNSPMLLGNLEPEDKITDRKMVSCINKQLDLF